ncbi:transposase [Telmatocola sphagniphila]|uniref:Transposase n=1 Tax=Telmatocola sphagniphila TaxID=1123043 RepID=A0A8E6B8H0_9BACT|nr:transposase [Telmatocola sphagniphila]
MKQLLPLVLLRYRTCAFLQLSYILEIDARKLAKHKNDLTAFLDQVAASLAHPRRRRWCECYFRGFLLDGQCKSVEPMAARLQAIEQGKNDYEQALQQFLNQSS